MSMDETPSDFWKEFAGYNEFQSFVKSVEVVKDSSERAVKLIQDNVERAKSEEKLQNLLRMKNSWKKPFKRRRMDTRRQLQRLLPRYWLS